MIRPFFARHHGRDGAAAAVEDRGQVGVHHSLPLQVRHVGEEPGVGNAGIVHQHVQTGTELINFLKDLPDLLRVSHVPGDKRALAGELLLDFLPDLLQLLQRGAAVEKDVPPLLGKAEGAGAADAPGGSCDEYVFYRLCCRHEHSPFVFIVSPILHQSIPAVYLSGQARIFSPLSSVHTKQLSYMPPMFLGS